MRSLLLSVLLLGLAAPVPAQVRAGRFETRPRIDGSLDEAVWRTASRLEGFVQTQPGDNIAASRPTVIRLGFDAEYLYIGIEATDDSALVRATVAARDNILADDHVILYLDTFGDRRRAYVLGFNPLGIQQDGIYTEGSAEPDYSVDVVMQSRGRTGPTGWAVEVAVPLSSFRYASGDGRQWNVQVQRRIKRLDNEQDSWRPLVRGSAGFLTQAAGVEGFERLPARRAVEVIPSVTAVSRGDRLAAGFSTASPRTDVGLSAKIGLAADVTAELAVNPDFAQVEADAPVVTANQRFPILFEEKRPFFLEGIGMFRTPLLVLHTRAIVDPVAAVKLTGKRGSTEFGLLASSDEAPGHGQTSEVGVFRVRREVGNASYVGLLGTGYHFVDRDNITAGTDMRVTSGSRFAASFQLTGTWARKNFYDPEQGRSTLRSGRGVGYAVELRKSGRHLNLVLAGKGRSRDYVSETGFTPQVNTNAWTFDTRWDAEPRPNATLISWSASHRVALQFDWRGRPTYAYLWPQLSLSFPRLTEVSAGPYVDYQRLFAEEFAGGFAGKPVRETVYHGFGVSVSSTPSRRWKTAASVGWSWNAFDYDFGGGPRFPRVSPAALADRDAPLDPGPGLASGGSLSVEWTPAAALRIAASYEKNRLTRNDTHRVAFDENIWSGQVVYRFGRFASVRLRADYRTASSNLRPQLLVAWTPNPGTAVYAGYNDDLNRDGYSPVTGGFEPGVHRNSRTVFVKLSYLVGAR